MRDLTKSDPAGYCLDARQNLLTELAEMLKSRGLDELSKELSAIGFISGGDQFDFVRENHLSTKKIWEEHKDNLNEKEKALLVLAMVMVMYHTSTGGKPQGIVNAEEVKIPQALMQFVEHGRYTLARELGLALVNKRHIFDGFAEREGFVGQDQKVQIQTALQGAAPAEATALTAQIDRIFSRVV